MRYPLYVFSFIFAALHGISAMADEPLHSEASDSKSLESPISCPATNGLLPTISLQKFSENWSVEIDLMAQTDLPKHSWLRVTNRVGSILRLWTTNGIELELKSEDARAALKLPSRITILEIMRAVPRRWRANQWLHTESRTAFPATTFLLQDAFGISFTNDFILQVTPLLYRVQSNSEIADLVRFPPIKLKLLSNGNVEKPE